MASVPSSMATICGGGRLCDGFPSQVSSSLLDGAPQIRIVGFFRSRLPPDSLLDGVPSWDPVGERAAAMAKRRSANGQPSDGGP